VKGLDIDKNEIQEIVNVIDWAISAGYNINKNKNIINILEKMVKEEDLNEKTDNYYEQRYGIK
jgi:hypothetical protein